MNWYDLALCIDDDDDDDDYYYNNTLMVMIIGVSIREQYIEKNEYPQKSQLALFTYNSAFQLVVGNHIFKAQEP